MPRLRDDRGATAVTVALAMVMLFGFAAISVDVGVLWSDKKQLQNGADAAALAIAQACAAGDCGDYETDADLLAGLNKVDGNAEAVEVDITDYATGSPGEVRVTTTSDRTPWFASAVSGLLGQGDTGPTEVKAVAAAQFGPPKSLEAPPIIVSWCWLKDEERLPGMAKEGDPIVIEIQNKGAGGGKDKDDKGKKKDDEPEDAGDSACDPDTAPGNFGWLEDDEDVAGCSATVAVGGTMNENNKTGNSAPCDGDELLEILGPEAGNIFSIPMFQNYVGSGSKATFDVIGFVSLEVEGYYITGAKGGKNPEYNPATNKSHIWGRIVKFTSSMDGELGGPDFGTRIVKLTE